MRALNWTCGLYACRIKNTREYVRIIRSYKSNYRTWTRLSWSLSDSESWGLLTGAARPRELDSTREDGRLGVVGMVKVGVMSNK